MSDQVDPHQPAPDSAAHHAAVESPQPKASFAKSFFTAKLLFWVVMVVALAADLGTKAWAESALTVRQKVMDTGLPEDAEHPSHLVDKNEMAWDVLEGRYEGIPGIKGVLHFKWAENYGAAFSLGAGHTALLAIISIGVLGIILFYMLRTPKQHRFTLICLALVCGGAVGNLHDRLLFKTIDDRWALPDSEGKPVLNPEYLKETTAVRDFLYWPFDIPVYSTLGIEEDQPTRKWPVFNIADVCIVSGVIGLVIVFTFAPDPKRRRKEEPDAATHAAA